MGRYQLNFDDDHDDDRDHDGDVGHDEYDNGHTGSSNNNALVAHGQDKSGEEGELIDGIPTEEEHHNGRPASHSGSFWRPLHRAVMCHDGNGDGYGDGYDDGSAMSVDGGDSYTNYDRKNRAERNNGNRREHQYPNDDRRHDQWNEDDPHRYGDGKYEDEKDYHQKSGQSRFFGGQSRSRGWPWQDHTNDYDDDSDSQDYDYDHGRGSSYYSESDQSEYSDYTNDGRRYHGNRYDGINDKGDRGDTRYDRYSRHRHPRSSREAGQDQRHPQRGRNVPRHRRDYQDAYDDVQQRRSRRGGDNRSKRNHISRFFSRRSADRDDEVDDGSIDSNSRRDHLYSDDDSRLHTSTNRYRDEGGVVARHDHDSEDSLMQHDDRDNGHAIAQNHYHVYYITPPAPSNNTRTSSSSIAIGVGDTNGKGDGNDNTSVDDSTAENADATGNPEGHRWTMPPYLNLPKWCSPWVVLVTFLAIVTNVLLAYGPPAPPIPTMAGGDHRLPAADATGEELKNLSWSSFMLQQGSLLIHLVYLWCFQLPGHVASWCWTGIQDDLLHKVMLGRASDFDVAPQTGCQWAPSIAGQSHLITSKKPTAHSGAQMRSEQPEIVPHTLVEQLQHTLEKDFMGHSIAMSKLSEALLHWRFSNSRVDDGNRTTLGKQHRAGPFFMYLASGAVGAGRTHLVSILAEVLFKPTSCTSDQAVLDLREWLISHDGSSETSVEHDLVKRLVDFQRMESSAFIAILPEPVMAAGGGSGSVDTGTRMMPDEKSSPYSLHDLWNEVQDYLDVLKDVIVIITTSPGALPSSSPPSQPSTTTKIIEKTIQKFGAEQAQRELPSFLAYELDRKHGSIDLDKSVGISKAFHVITPLLPLTPGTMRRILQKRLEASMMRQADPALYITQIHTNRRLLDSLLRRNIEFQTWIHKATNQELFSYATHGAHSIDPLVQQMARSMGSCWKAIGPDTSVPTPSRWQLIPWGLLFSPARSPQGTEAKTHRMLTLGLEHNSEYVMIVRMCNAGSIIPDVDTVEGNGDVGGGPESAVRGDGGGDDDGDGSGRSGIDQHCDLLCRVQL